MLWRVLSRLERREDNGDEGVPPTKHALEDDVSTAWRPCDQTSYSSAYCNDDTTYLLNAASGVEASVSSSWLRY